MPWLPAWADSESEKCHNKRLCRAGQVGPDCYTERGTLSVFAVDKLISEARRIAAEYRRTTGKSLGLSSEIAKHDACRLLDLEPCESPPGGYDAVGRGERDGVRVQIKGRAIFEEGKSGQRIGQFKTNQDWDRVVLVLMDKNFEPYEIYEVDREDVEDALDDAGSSSRKRRGAMSVARFKKISRLVWDRAQNADDSTLDTHAGS